MQNLFLLMVFDFRYMLLQGIIRIIVLLNQIWIIFAFENEFVGIKRRQRTLFSCNALQNVHARLRHQCSSLNSDLYRINITNDPKCQYGAPYEDSIHYLNIKLNNMSVCIFLHFLNKNINKTFFGPIFVGLEAESAYFMTSLTES